MLYFFNDKPNGSQTYSVEATENLFSINSRKLLFFDQDIDFLKFSNDSLKIVRLNKTLNYLSKKLRSKGVTLIVLPCPDKYDMYYSYIQNQNKYPRPLFFRYYNKLPKSYVYINSKEILSSMLYETKDIYYWDDTHWSPIAAQRIAREISKAMKQHELDNLN